MMSESPEAAAGEAPVQPLTAESGRTGALVLAFALTDVQLGTGAGDGPIDVAIRREMTETAFLSSIRHDPHFQQRGEWASVFPSGHQLRRPLSAVTVPWAFLRVTSLAGIGALVSSPGRLARTMEALIALKVEIPPPVLVAWESKLRSHVAILDRTLADGGLTCARRRGGLSPLAFPEQGRRLVEIGRAERPLRLVTAPSEELRALGLWLAKTLPVGAAFATMRYELERNLLLIPDALLESHFRYHSPNSRNAVKKTGVAIPWMEDAIPARSVALVPVATLEGTLEGCATTAVDWFLEGIRAAGEHCIVSMGRNQSLGRGKVLLRTAEMTRAVRVVDQTEVAPTVVPNDGHTTNRVVREDLLTLCRHAYIDLEIDIPGDARGGFATAINGARASLADGLQGFFAFAGSERGETSGAKLLARHVVRWISFDRSGNLPELPSVADEVSLRRTVANGWSNEQLVLQENLNQARSRENALQQFLTTLSAHYPTE